VLARIALVLLVIGGRAHADDRGPAYELTAEIDVPVLAISGIATSAWFFDLGPAWCAPECDSTRLNALDRPFAGRHVPAWTTAGTITAGVVMATPPVLLGLFERPRYAASDTVVIGEAMLVASGVGALLQTAVRRPRPFVYGTSAPLTERLDTSASLSFPSGHTALSFAATFATWRTLDRLRVAPRWKYLVLGVAVAGSSFVAVSRVIAGDHFPTDVIAGAGLGASAGVLIPALHRHHVRLAPMAGGLAATGAF
jgi:membrane-associated phospholipid phosphatase